MSPQPPKKNAPGIFEINSPALAWQNLFSPTLVRGTCFFRLPTIVLLAQADFLSVFEYIYRIPQYILLIRLITDQISICIYIYIYQYVICQYIPRYKYMLLKSNHESCDMVWLLCLFWGFACIGWHFQTIVCSIRTSPTSEWTPKRYESLPSENLRWVCWRFEIHILDFRGMSSQLCWIAGTTRR